MRKLLLTASALLISASLFGQTGIKEVNKDEGKEENLAKPSAITDRAGGTHNASAIGLFFENRGKLYPRRITQGPSGEFPINSGKHYIYRINPMVGIPKNVVQGRYTTNEEWEAVGGYHNPEGALIAFSDNPATWPETGWPVKDAAGNDVVKSDQDSYCVYDDANNTRDRLGITIAQTGYAYGVSFAKNLLFFKYEVINNGDKNLSGIYFNLYTDIDVGNISGGDPEYGDDKIGFIKEKNFLYFYDDGLSKEWDGGKTGFFGLAVLQTPAVNGAQLGITDMHYNLYDDDSDIDSVQYGIMSSSPVLYNNSVYKSKYFHLGSSTNLHYDDVGSIPASGMDLVANAASGPYTLNPGDTLTFITAFVAGETETELLSSLDQAYRVMDFNFELSKPPATPEISASANDGKIMLYWNDDAEYSVDNFSGEYDFEGYRLYRSMDKGVNWELLKEYDLQDDIGLDAGLQYSYTDSSIINGLEYWYSITAYDRGYGELESLESPKGNTSGAKNIAAVTAYSDASGRKPAVAENLKNIGGSSNYAVLITPRDNDALAGGVYKIGFKYEARRISGANNIYASINVFDSSLAVMNKYGVEFVDSKSFNVIDYSTGEFLRDEPFAYVSGQRYTLKRNSSGKILELKIDGPSASDPAEEQPKKGDKLILYYSVYAVKNGTDTVAYPRPFELDQYQSTSDGVVFKITAPNPVQDVSRIGGSGNFNLLFTAANTAALQNQSYIISVTGWGENASGSGFINLLVRNESGDTVSVIDSLYTLGSFTFNGLQCVADFPQNNPPAAGNAYSVTSIKPSAPTLKDIFTFSIKGSVVDKQAISASMSDIKVVPNPYVVSSIYEPEYGELRKEPLRQIQFINLPPVCDIYIFSIDADLVKTIHHDATSGTAVWDLRSEGGREIAPGVYVYLVKSQEIEHLSRFAVIK
jgi:hypothetical protein